MVICILRLEQAGAIRMMSAVLTEVSDIPPQIGAPPRRLLPMRWALLAVSCSGASGLICELIWSRYLHLIFGVSAYAVAAVLACFMLGLAVGSDLAGRFLDRYSINSRRAVIAIELLIGIWLMLSPLIYRAAGGWIAAVLPSGHDSHFSRYFLDLAVAMALLAVPTLLMGASLPAFVRAAVPSAGRIGGGVGSLYALNTLGGATGAFAAGFILLPWLGMSVCLILGGFLNVLAAGIVWRRSVSELPAPPAPKKPARPAAAPATLSPRLLLLLSAVFCISGFTSLAYEVYWTRLLSYFFRDTIYDFTIVLTAFLAGIALGSAIGGWIARRGRDWLVSTIGTAQVLIALCALISLMLASQFPYWINDLQTNTAAVREYGQRYWTAATAVRFAYAFLLMLVPTTLFGAMYPMVCGVCVRELPRLASRFGRLNALNAAGSALGALLAGFVLIDQLGVRNCILLTAALNLLAGAALLRHWRWRIIALLGFAIALAAVPPWDRLRMSSSFLDPHQRLEQLLSLKFYREDAYGITSVVDVVPINQRFLVTNRIYAQNTSAVGGLEDHRRLGEIPMLLHPNPQQVLTIGLGAGMTLRGIQEFAPQQVDCVEIAPAVIDAAKLFEAENGGVLNASNVSLIADDGRHFLTTTAKDYDAIVLDILHPMSSGSSGIFAREYYRLCRRALQPGGIVCQWLPAHQLSIEQIRTIIATFHSVFPHTSLWYGMIGDSVAVIGCIGSEQPLLIDVSGLAERYENPALQQSLHDVALGTPSLLLSHFIMADGALDQWIAGAPLDTDDRPIIEFAAPRVAVQARELGVENLNAMAPLMGDLSPYLKGDPPPRLALDRVAKQRVIEGLKPLINGDPAGQIRIYRAALSSDADSEDLRTMLRAAER
jgi:spermidine synthase